MISLFQNDSNMDENGVAYNILPLATAFCRVSFTCSVQHAKLLMEYTYKQYVLKKKGLGEKKRRK